MSFDASFDSSFDSNGGSPLPPQYATVTASLAVQIVSPLVFSTAAGHVRWSPTITINGDVLAVTGAIKISAAEDSARVASFSVVPATPAQLDGFESSAVTIDITLFQGVQSATMRRFTGVVETVEFDPAACVATLQCRDGYQERPKACASADDVEALFDGLAVPCRRVVKWDDETPDPVAYFSAVQATLLGSCAIDSSGVWRATPWTIGAPQASFAAADVFSDSIRVERASRRELPSAIRATLNFRYYRLHSAEKSLTWDDPGLADHMVYGFPLLNKSTVQQALDGLNGWMVKGKATLDGPTPGTQLVLIGGNLTPVNTPSDVAQTTVEHLAVTMYRRWYQQINAVYAIDIPMGGVSDRDDVAAVTLESSFDASLWETTPSAEDTLGIYSRNAPSAPTPPTGYEGLPLPWPPVNSAMDHYPDVSPSELQQAAGHVVALALRRAALGRRKQTITFERPFDPRWEIGDVLSVAVYGADGTGQVIAFEDSLDVDSGDAVSSITLACPNGTGQTTAFSASVTAPTVNVTHALTMPALGTHMGGWNQTPLNPNDDNLLGYLCNIVEISPAADPAAHAYIPQFRIIMPEIAANVRDPETIDLPITASVDIAGSGLAVTF